MCDDMKYCSDKKIQTPTHTDRLTLTHIHMHAHVFLSLDSRYFPIEQ